VTLRTKHIFALQTLTFVCVVLAVLVCLNCSQPLKSAVCEVQKPAPEPGYGSACMNIHGTVDGDLIPGAQVYLFQLSSLNFSVVMSEIRTVPALSWQPVSESGSFEFHCLPAGNYAFVIPMSSYDGWVGFPVPYEFDCENFSVRLDFHGGDYQYAVGAFRLIDTRIEHVEKCTAQPWICRDLMGSLYRECHNNSAIL